MQIPGIYKLLREESEKEGKIWTHNSKMAGERESEMGPPQGLQALYIEYVRRLCMGSR